MQSTVVAIGDVASFFGNEYDNGVGFLTQPYGGAVACPQGVVNINAPGERENTGGIHDAVAPHHDAAIVHGGVGEENGIQHLRSQCAIYQHAAAGFLMDIYGALDRDDAAGALLGQLVGGLYDRIDIQRTVFV